MAEGKAVFTAATLEDKRNLPGKDHLGPRDGQQEAQAPITVIIGGRALLKLIAARFSGSGSGKDLLSRAISLIASGLLPFSSFPIPVAPDLVSTGPPCLQNPVCSKRDGPQAAAAVRSDTRNLARASLVALSSIEGLLSD